MHTSCIEYTTGEHSVAIAASLYQSMNGTL